MTVVAAALALGAPLVAAPTAAADATTATASQARVKAPTAQKAAQKPKLRAPHKKKCQACNAKKVRRRSKKPPQTHAAEHRAPHRPRKRFQAALQFEIPQGDGSPVLGVAAQLLGRPYRFGSQHGAFDCSGFVRTVFEELGIELPHSARDQFALGDRVARDALEPGDLVFFRTYRRDASHVGIYVGDDKFVHAATRGGQVQVDSLSDGYYARRYLGARRIEI